MTDTHTVILRKKFKPGETEATPGSLAAAINAVINGKTGVQVKVAMQGRSYLVATVVYQG